MEGAGPLDLSGADTSGFEPLPTGRYLASVFEAEWREVQGEGGSMPKGTPMLNVQFRLSEKIGDSEVKAENRRVFQSYFPAPPSDHQNAARMKGFFVNFLKAAGYEEKKIMKPGFNLDLEDLKGRELVVVLGYQAADEERGYEARNTVRGVKSVDEAAVSSGSGLL